MARRLDAVYEQGVLPPLEPLSLPEHQRVRLSLEAEPEQLRWKSTEPVNERREEMQWFSEGARPYAGQWVAIEGPRLVAHGVRLLNVRAAAKAAGASDPRFARVPSHSDPFGGW